MEDQFQATSKLKQLKVKTVMRKEQVDLFRSFNKDLISHFLLNKRNVKLTESFQVFLKT